MSVRHQLKVGSGHSYRDGGSTIASGLVPNADVDSVGTTH